jgi:RNA polymerase sigma-70 factor (ECF subfamily)
MFEGDMTGNNTTGQLQNWLQRLQAGDDQARAHLVELACERLRLLAHRMLRRYPRVQRWEQTDDVVQNATLRLYRALQDVRPETAERFFGLAALYISRELKDLNRHHFGPEATAAHHATPAPAGDNSRPLGAEGEAEADSGSLDAWAAFHEQVQTLPDEEQQIVNLLFYHELSQADAATLLGVSERTVKRRWQSARLLLHAALQGKWPER